MAAEQGSTFVRQVHFCSAACLIYGSRVRLPIRRWPRSHWEQEERPVEAAAFLSGQLGLLEKTGEISQRYNASMRALQAGRHPQIRSHPSPPR